MDKELEKTFQYYLDNLEELYKKYPNKFLALKDCKVLGVYDSYDDALEETLKNHEIGTFLIQRVDINPSSYTLYLNSFSVMNR